MRYEQHKHRWTQQPKQKWKISCIKKTHKRKSGMQSSQITCFFSSSLFRLVIESRGKNIHGTKWKRAFCEEMQLTGEFHIVCWVWKNVQSITKQAVFFQKRYTQLNSKFEQYKQTGSKESVNFFVELIDFSSSKFSHSYSFSLNKSVLVQLLSYDIHTHSQKKRANNNNQKNRMKRENTKGTSKMDSKLMRFDFKQQ